MLAAHLFDSLAGACANALRNRGHVVVELGQRGGDRSNRLSELGADPFGELQGDVGVEELQLIALLAKDVQLFDGEPLRRDIKQAALEQLADQISIAADLLAEIVFGEAQPDRGAKTCDRGKELGASDGKQVLK